jgi:hypothetical protein
MLMRIVQHRKKREVDPTIALLAKLAEQLD